MGQREKSGDWIYLCLKDYTSGGESTIWLINHESIFIWGRKSKKCCFLNVKDRSEYLTQ